VTILFLVSEKSTFFCMTLKIDMHAAFWGGFIGNELNDLFFFFFFIGRRRGLN